MVEFKDNLQNAAVSSLGYNLNQVADKNYSLSFTVSEYSPCLFKSCDDELIDAKNTDANQASSFFQINSDLFLKEESSIHSEDQNKIILNQYEKIPNYDSVKKYKSK